MRYILSCALEFIGNAIYAVGERFLFWSVDAQGEGKGSWEPWTEPVTETPTLEVRADLIVDSPESYTFNPGATHSFTVVHEVPEAP